jgi:hypothetical protein
MAAIVTRQTFSTVTMVALKVLSSEMDQAEIRLIFIKGSFAEVFKNNPSVLHSVRAL